MKVKRLIELLSTFPSESDVCVNLGFVIPDLYENIPVNEYDVKTEDDDVVVINVTM